MPISTITIDYEDGAAAVGARVELAFPGGLTKPSFTNRYGEAVIEHASVGRAEIYVSGHKAGAFDAPGKTVVVLRRKGID